MRAQRNLKFAFFTRTWKGNKLTEDTYEDPEEAPKLAKGDGASVVDFIEEFPEILSTLTGTGGRPLSYVIREMETPPDEVGDPLFGTPNSRYGSLREEVAARSMPPSQGPHFGADNIRVYELLRNAISDFKRVLVWIKGHARAKDGHQAWFDFKAHFLGSAQLDNIATKAEDRMEYSVYSGKKPRYTFEIHVSIHQKAHLDIAKATGQALDERTKVRHFLKSIQARELEVPVATVKATPNLCDDWTSCVNYLRGFIKPAVAPRRQVAATGNTPPGEVYTPESP